MSDLFEDTPTPAGNSPEFSVSELVGAVKRVIEGEFGLVRGHAEVERVSRHTSGHLYFDFTDDRCVMVAVRPTGLCDRVCNCKR
jgi:exodeoxyribonuclease VII large subunit